MSESVAEKHNPAKTGSRIDKRIKLKPGEPFPLGATWDGNGTNFSLFSEVAERVELCLFDEQGSTLR